MGRVSIPNQVCILLFGKSLYLLFSMIPVLCEAISKYTICRDVVETREKRPDWRRADPCCVIESLEVK